MKWRNLCVRLLYSLESLLQIGDYVIDMLGADGEPDGIGADSLVEKLLFGEL